MAAEARPSLHLSKRQIVGNLMPRLKLEQIQVHVWKSADPCIVSIADISK